MAIIDLSLFLGLPHRDYYAGVALILAKVYSNSLLVMFNTQIRIVGARNWAPPEVTAPMGRANSQARSNDSGENKKTMRLTLSTQSAAMILGSSTGEGESWDSSDVIHLSRKVRPHPSVDLSDDTT